MKKRINKRPKPKATADSDAVSAEWWKKRRADIMVEIKKPADLRQTVMVFMGRPFAPGTFTAEAYHNDFPIPLAVVWYSFTGLNVLQVNNIYTFEPVRRCGLMTLVMDTLRTWYPHRDFVTGAGTPDGKAWMLANGWKKTEAGWERRRK